MNESDKIDILLPTYNSGKYLNDLLDSILQQTYLNWQLLIRDDGSWDHTVENIKGYLYDSRIRLIEDNKKNIGARNSFNELLKLSNSSYIMFCDHDDIWLRDKIEKTYLELKKGEELFPKLPIIIHSDLTVVDSNSNVLYRSFMKRSRLNANYADNIYKLAINNVVTGCTMIFNKQVKEISFPISEKAVMHDWWLALNTALKGKIIFYPHSTILYRQHLNNTCGAKIININYYLTRFKNINITIQENIRQYKMLKSLDFHFNIGLLIYYKVIITIKKMFKAK